MRRILLAAAGTLAATVAVFLYPTSTNRPVTAAAETAAVASPAVTETTAPSATTESSTSSTDTSTATPSATDPATTAPAAGDTTASGTTSTASTAATGSFASSTSMRFGTVTVTVTVADGAITDVSATQSSNDQRSQMISAQAIPILNSEAVAAQSAAVSMVSHATYTSQAYAQSLQAAIDQAFGA